MGVAVAKPGRKKEMDQERSRVEGMGGSPTHFKLLKLPEFLF